MTQQDDITQRLNEIHADAGYLFGRVAADGACAGAMAESVRARIDAIKALLSKLRAPVADERASVRHASGRQYHVLKTDPEVFQAVLSGAKTFEIRLNDRGYGVGDVLGLRETKHTGAEMRAGAPLVYTGRECQRFVSHVLTGYGLADGWCCLSFRTPHAAGESVPVASAEVMDALNWVDDFIARCNRDDRGSCESVNVLRRALASAPVADERAAFSRAEVSFPLTIPENRVYLAGPMTGYEDHNFPAFHAAAERLRGSGLEVVNPADHGLLSGLGWSDYMRWDLVKLAGCHAVYVLPGWEKSKGASLEISIARALGMPVFTVDGAPLASATVTDDKCLTCSGHGMVGGLTPHSGYDAKPCPDCTPVAGEAQPSDADITKTIRVLMDEARHTRCADGEMGVRVQDVMIARAVLARYGHTPLPMADAAPQASECECSRKSKAVSDSEAQL